MRILFVLLSFLFAVSVSAKKIFVISVGIADYKEINDLRYTENDVMSFNTIMSRYDAEIVSLLGKEATHSNIIKYIRAVSAQAKADDDIFFFFSGHGYEGGFCCYDQKPNSYIGGISYQEIQILFKNCRAGKKVIIADACFSGGLSKQRTALTVQAVQKSDVIFFLSSQFDETSLELPNGPNGLFTYILENGLNGAADTNNDGQITYQEIYSYVSENVSQYASQIPHNQHPRMWGNFNSKSSLISIR